MRLTILTLTTILSYGLFAQDENRFRNFHGIKQTSADFFEAEGYEIFIQQVDNGLNEKGIRKIKKKYSIKAGQLTTDSVLNLKVLTMTEEKNGVTAHLNYYLIPGAENKSTVVGFIRLKTRDIGLERDFVKSHLTNSVPPFVYTKLEIDSIDFVGRTIKLEPVCRWMSPHNIQCPDSGQMSWAIFDNLKQAEEYRDTQFEMAKNKNLVDLKEQRWITLKFEGQEAKALRARFKIQMPKLVMGGSNILVVYYVSGQVRGKYVTCILSQYTDDTDGDRLPPLLSEVLTLQNPDGTWVGEERTSIYESNPKPDSLIDQNEKRIEDRGFVKLEAGIWIPVGKLSSKVGVSPNFGIHLALIDNPKLRFRVDCIISLFIPQNTKEFEYSLKDSVFMTKIGAPAGVFGLLLTKTKNISNNTVIDYFDQTYGLGIGIFPTITEEPKENPEDRTKHYHFDTVHLSYGVAFRKKIFRHKSVGLAFRYNFTPTGWFDSNVGQGFGNSSVTTSLQLKI